MPSALIPPAAAFRVAGGVVIPAGRSTILIGNGQQPPFLGGGGQDPVSAVEDMVDPGGQNHGLGLCQRGLGGKQPLSGAVHQPMFLADGDIGGEPVVLLYVGIAGLGVDREGFLLLHGKRRACAQAEGSRQSGGNELLFHEKDLLKIGMSVRRFPGQKVPSCPWQFNHPH